MWLVIEGSGWEELMGYVDRVGVGGGVLMGCVA